MSDSDVVHHRVDVAAANDEWTDTGITVEGDDLVVIFVKGEVTIGGLYGEVGADGAISGAGRLYAKIGATKTLPGRKSGRIRLLREWRAQTARS
jgi:hypothetical protein